MIDLGCPKIQTKGKGGERERERESGINLKMKGEEARIVLGFPPNYRPSRSEIKAAYKTKVWSCHPDLFPPNQKPLAESSFKSVRFIKFLFLYYSNFTLFIHTSHMHLITADFRSLHFVALTLR